MNQKTFLIVIGIFIIGFITVLSIQYLSGDGFDFDFVPGFLLIAVLILLSEKYLS